MPGILVPTGRAAQRPAEAAKPASVVGSASGASPVSPRPATAGARRDRAERRFDVLDRRPAGERHEARDDARLEDVDVERDVDARRLRRARGSRSSSIPCAATYSCSGGSRSRAPTSATSPARTLPSSIAIRRGIPHSLPDGDVSGVLRSPWASSQTTPIRPCRARGRGSRRRASSSSRRARAAAPAGRRRVLRSARRASRARRRAPRGTGARSTRRRPSPRHRRPTRAGRARARLRTRRRSCGTRTRRRTRPR